MSKFSWQYDNASSNFSYNADDLIKQFMHHRASRTETEEFKTEQWRRKYSLQTDKALFMQRTECPACRINLYVWEKATEALCTCGVKLKRADK